MINSKQPDLPSSNDVDIAELKARYRLEREKRMRKEGQDQYVRPVDDFSYTYEGDPYTPVAPREPISEDIEIAILGGGWSGIKQAMTRGAVTIEATEEAQSAYVQHLRDTEVDRTEWLRDCTPGYFNNEGKPDVDENGNERYRFYLGEVYGPGWDAFVEMLSDWRATGELPGVRLELAKDEVLEPV